VPSGGTVSREAALAWASTARERRAALRADLSSGRRTLAEVLAARDDAHDGRVRLLFVLESLPGAGKVATRRRLGQLGLDELTPLQDLDDATCALVLEEFPVGVGS
jgi:hypothetical protein